MRYVFISVIVIANVMYHLSQKSIPQTINPIVSIIVSYFVAIIISLIILVFYPSKQVLGDSLKNVNWASIIVGCSIVGVELGFFLAYRSGWNISRGAVISNVAVSIILIPIGICFFNEQLSAANVTGIALCILGMILIVWK